MIKIYLDTFNLLLWLTTNMQAGVQHIGSLELGLFV